MTASPGPLISRKNLRKTIFISTKLVYTAGMTRSMHTREYGAFTSLLREAREESGLTQEALGRKMGMPQTHISLIERGGRRLDIIELRRFCKAVGVPLPGFVELLERALR